jgi:hypothetical protein
MTPITLDEIPGGAGFWYLASPYSAYPGGTEAAVDDVAYIAARLLALGVPFYCPVAETHTIAATGIIDHLGHEEWMAHDIPILAAARGVLVAGMDGWEYSRGVTEEIEIAREAGKPVLLLAPISAAQ